MRSDDEEPDIVELDIVEKIIEDYKAGREIKLLDIAQAFATCLRAHKNLRDRDDPRGIEWEMVSVPYGLLAALGKVVLNQRLRSIRERREEISGRAEQEHARIRNEAEEIRHRNPRMSTAAVAQQLVDGPNPPVKWVKGRRLPLTLGVVRRIISEK